MSPPPDDTFGEGAAEGPGKAGRADGHFGRHGRHLPFQIIPLPTPP